MTNVCLPFGRKTRATWTLYWTISSLMLKSPRRIFWSQCLLWVPFFRTCKDGWWYGKSISPYGYGQWKSSCVLFVGWMGLGLWIDNFLHLPLSLTWRNLLLSGKDCSGCYAYSHAGTQMSWLSLEMPCTSPFLLSLMIVTLKFSLILANVLFPYNLFHEYQQ